MLCQVGDGFIARVKILILGIILNALPRLPSPLPTANPCLPQFEVCVCEIGIGPHRYVLIANRTNKKNSQEAWACKIEVGIFQHFN